MDSHINENSDPEDEDLDENDILRVIDLNADEGAVNEESGEDMEEERAEAEDEPAVDDKAAVVFSAHIDKPYHDSEPPEVYAVNIDPSGSGRVVSGGRDDSAYVWVMNSGQVLFECKGHKDSVCCVGFSHDGRYVASADLEGVIKVWHCDTQKEVWSYECGSGFTWIQWHRAAPVLLAGTESGEIWMWQVPDWSKMKMLQSHGCSSLCGKILPNGTNACVGYADGVVKLWDLKTGSAVHTWQHAAMPEEDMNDDDGDEGQEKDTKVAGDGSKDEDGATSPVAILCVDCSADNSLIMSGCADATSKVFSVSSGKLVSTFRCVVHQDKDNSVESVAFSPLSPYAATSTNSGAVEIWDLPSSVVRQTLQHPRGVCKVKWSSSSLLLYTACVDGVTRVWDARNGASKALLTGHANQHCVLDFDITKDDTCLVSGSEDGTARVFDLRFMQS